MVRVPNLYLPGLTYGRIAYFLAPLPGPAFFLSSRL